MCEYAVNSRNCSPVLVGSVARSSLQLFLFIKKRRSRRPSDARVVVQAHPKEPKFELHSLFARNRAGGARRTVKVEGGKPF